MNKSRIKDRGSKATQVIEEAWKMLRHVIGTRRLPPAVIVIFGANARQKKLGHFARSSWRYLGDNMVHEIGISPHLFENPEDLLATLVHEAIHSFLYHVDSANPKHSAGCSLKNKYYHTKEFRDACRKNGLECNFHNNRYGWTKTGWPKGKVPENYKEIVKFLRKFLPWGTGLPFVKESIKGNKLPASGHTRLSCSCKKKRSIYVSKKESSLGQIFCHICSSKFECAT